MFYNIFFRANPLSVKKIWAYTKIIVILRDILHQAMSGKEKLIERFKTLPRDFTFDEVIKLMHGLGFELSNKGSTSGSRVRFNNPTTGANFAMHKPHPGNVMVIGAMRSLYDFLKNSGFLK